MFTYDNKLLAAILYCIWFDQIDTIKAVTKYEAVDPNMF